MRPKHAKPNPSGKLVLFSRVDSRPAGTRNCDTLPGEDAHDAVARTDVCLGSGRLCEAISQP